MPFPVSILAAGGTIAMSGPADGPAAPELTGEALVGAVPELASEKDLRVRTIAVLPSAHLTGADALGIAQAAAAEAEQGRGVVVTTGTDTLEEVAFLCDLIYAGNAPIVFTGAMRPASAPGADGPANLTHSVRVARSRSAAGAGVLVVFAGEIHAARAVRKADSTALAAFRSPQGGAIGRVEEDRVSIDRTPERRAPLSVDHLEARVEILVAALGSDGRIVDAALAAGVDGLVAVVLGAGHTPPPLFAALERAVESVPVIATVRPKRGAILRDTYAFAGSERDLRDSRLIPAGALSSAAARIKLMACLGAGLDRAAIAGTFAPDDA